MRKIKPDEEAKVKRVNVNIPLQLHNQFKPLAAARGDNMTDVLLEFIRDYVRKHSPKERRR